MARNTTSSGRHFHRLVRVCMGIGNCNPYTPRYIPNMRPKDVNATDTVSRRRLRPPRCPCPVISALRYIGGSERYCMYVERIFQIAQCGRRHCTQRLAHCELPIPCDINYSISCDVLLTTMPWTIESAFGIPSAADLKAAL